MEQLPVTEILPDLRKALAEAGRAVLQAPPGAGKTTLVPLDLPRSWALGNATINRLLYTPGGLSLVGWDDAAHLDALVSGDDASA